MVGLAGDRHPTNDTQHFVAAVAADLAQVTDVPGVDALAATTAARMIGTSSMVVRLTSPTHGRVVAAHQVTDPLWPPVGEQVLVHDREPQNCPTAVDQPSVVASPGLAQLSIPLRTADPVVVLFAIRGSRDLGVANFESVVPIFALALDRLADRERLSAEAERRLTSTKRWQTVTDHSTDVVRLADPCGTVLYESVAVERILGLCPVETIGTHVLDVVHPADRPRVGAHFAALERTVGMQPPLLFRATHRDGATRHLEATAQNLLSDPAVGGILIHYRDVTKRVRREDRLRRQALHDPLTRLPNRRLFHQRLVAATARARRGSDIAVLFIDLDDFKTMNDSLGHAAGDRILRVFSARLRRIVRAGDTAARLGGDEFAVLLEPADPDCVDKTASRIFTELRRPIVVGAQQVSVGASVGIVHDDGTATATTLLHRADAAMYHAKAAGKDRAATFQLDMLT